MFFNNYTDLPSYEYSASDYNIEVINNEVESIMFLGNLVINRNNLYFYFEIEKCIFLLCLRVKNKNETFSEICFLLIFNNIVKLFFYIKLYIFQRFKVLYKYIN